MVVLSTAAVAAAAATVSIASVTAAAFFAARSSQPAHSCLSSLEPPHSPSESSWAPTEMEPLEEQEQGRRMILGVSVRWHSGEPYSQPVIRAVPWAYMQARLPPEELTGTA